MDEADRRGDEPRTYRMAFPTKAGPMSCPAEGCSGRVSTRTAVRVYFWNRHVRDTVAILEEGNPPPHSRFPLYDILLTWKALNGTHRFTA